MNNRLFVVKKPSVIECKYYAAGSIYKSSSKMSDIALNTLIENNFLEEKPIIKDNKKIVDDFLASAQARCGHLQYHLTELTKELKEAREALENL